MRAHLRLPQSTRGLLIAVVALALALGGAAAGLTLSMGSASADQKGLSRAIFPGFQLSFSYPSAWRRKDWCWIGNGVFPVTLLMTGQPPRCLTLGPPLGGGTPLPPKLRLRTDGVAVWLVAVDRRGLGGGPPNMQIGGRPARITVRSEPMHRGPSSYANCVGTGPTRRLLNARIEGPSSRVRLLRVGAVICGPDFAAGEAQVRQLLASLRFTS